ncbi:hydrogenase [Desulfococcaceae bacterium OttesenSCG-928-F15]|nr:hydrogenase [Desulfococcaceae bacterium OttesenSCG-928-F15]
MLEALILIPVISGSLAFFLPLLLSRMLLMLTALVHVSLSIALWLGGPVQVFSGFFAKTPFGMLVMLITSFIFLFIALYTPLYIEKQDEVHEQTFIGCILLFLATMSMAAMADHPVVLWIAIEATTLASAPLIFIHRSKQALEATWKYVLICSVGIALALLGFFFITLSMERAGLDIPITFSHLNDYAADLDPLWLKTGFIFVLIGFGTKMGLAPMHTWLPDAHSEAPSPASALLSGTLLNCAFIGIYKVHCLMVLAGLGEFSGGLLILFGLLSMLVAGIFLLDQQDYKRMLAYSSIENMGIIAFGVGIGGLALYGAMLHIMHHSLIKSSLFLSAGNILLGYGTKLVSKVCQMTKILPGTFLAFLGGSIGISGLPPFGIFISEILIILGAFRTGHFTAAILFILCLVLVIAGFAKNFIRMSFGTCDEEISYREKPLRLVSPIILLLASIVLSFWIPEALLDTIDQATALIEGGRFHG